MSIRRTLSFPATTDGLHRAADDVRRTLSDSDLPPRSRYNIELVFEEIVTNIIRHGATDPGAAIDASVELGAGESVLTFEDGGAPFDPRERPDPPKPSHLDDAKLGGLGLMLVRKAAGRIDYERTEQQRNRLTVTIPRT